MRVRDKKWWRWSIGPVLLRGQLLPSRMHSRLRARRRLGRRKG